MTGTSQELPVAVSLATGSFMLRFQPVDATYTVNRSAGVSDRVTLTEVGLAATLIGHSGCWPVKQKPTAKRTSNLADVQEILAEPFPGTVAQGVSLPKV